MGARINGGYILLARRMLTSGIMEKPPLQLKLWVWMLMQASHTEHGSLKRGQFFISIERMREAMSYKVGYRKVTPSRKEIRVAYESLVKGTMIGTTKVTRGMLITIRNYDLYQTPANYEGHSEGHDEKSLEGTLKTRKDNKKGRIADDLKRSRPKKQTNPDIRKFMDWYVIEYEKVHGVRYHVNGSKEAPLIQKLLKTHPLEKLKGMAGVFLRSEDPFRQKAGFTIGVFHGQANPLALATAEKPLIVDEELTRQASEA